MSLGFGCNAWSKSDIYNINNNINEEKEKKLNGRKKTNEEKEKQLN
jgi:hypothetical protein